MNKTKARVAKETALAYKYAVMPTEEFLQVLGAFRVCHCICPEEQAIRADALRRINLLGRAIIAKPSDAAIQAFERLVAELSEMRKGATTPLTLKQTAQEFQEDAALVRSALRGK